MKSKIEVKIDGEVVLFDKFTFSGGEEHVKFDVGLNPPRSIKVTAHISDSAGIIQLAMIKDSLDAINVDGVKIHLYLPYIPYARQDRRCESGEAFGIKVFAKMLNSMNFSTVMVSDPHSDVATALIDNVLTLPQHVLFSQSDIFRDGFHSDDVVLCAPDGGALKKAFKVASVHNKELITAEKLRCTRTGKILKTVVNSDDLTGKTVWIVDDICDGGVTFIKLAEALKDKGAEEVNLWVTHGIFSKGKEPLYDGGITKAFAYYDWTEL